MKQKSEGASTRFVTLVRHILPSRSQPSPGSSASIGEGGRSVFLRLWQFLLHCAHGYFSDRIPQKAASLAYQTVLAIVPVFTVAFSVLNSFTGWGGIDSPIVQFLSRHLIPVSPDDIVGHIADFSMRISVSAIGWIGVAALFVVSLLLFDTVEKAINDIFQTENRRPFLFRLVTYYAVLTLGPLLLMISLVQTARVQVLLPTDVGGFILSYLFPMGITWLALVLSYKLFPHTSVRWRSVMVGALLGAILFEVAKASFNFYVSALLIHPYSRIYGAIALFPVFLVWILIAWNVVLLGARAAYVHQNLHRLVDERRLMRYSGLKKRELFLLANDRVALAVMVLLAANFARHRGPCTEEELTRKTGIPASLVRAVLHRLSHLGFVIIREERDERSYLPARPITSMGVGEFMRLYRTCGHGAVLPRPSPAVSSFLARLEDVILAQCGEETVVDLISSQDAASESQHPGECSQRQRSDPAVAG